MLRLRAANKKAKSRLGRGVRCVESSDQIGIPETGKLIRAFALAKAELVSGLRALLEAHVVCSGLGNAGNVGCKRPLVVLGLLLQAFAKLLHELLAVRASATS